MRRELYWLWLCNLPGIGQQKRQALLSCFGHVKTLFEMDEELLRPRLKLECGFSGKLLETIINSRDPDRVGAYAGQLERSGISLIDIEHPDYPDRLKRIFDPPHLLYCRGKMPDILNSYIAVIGARRCSNYGMDTAALFAKGLAEAGFTVVSGMARGIDTAAHEGAMLAKRETMAVLGCGVNVCYPKENRKVMNRIIEHGCVISETPVDAAPIAGNFPLRNRIISGICQGVLVVEAAEKSGSLITADSALEQGKDVFAVPGRIFDPLSRGTNRLIQMGAKAVLSVEDILEEYGLLNVKKTELFENKKLMLEKDEEIVYSCISLEPVHMDVLLARTGHDLALMQYVLIKLELKGLIEQLPNHYYYKKL